MFQFIVKVLLRIFAGAVIACRGMHFLICRISRVLRFIGRHGFPPLLFFYFLGRKLKTRLVVFLKPLQGRMWYLFSHRYFVHGLVVAIAIIVSMPAISAADTSQESFGDQIPLRALITDEEHEPIVIDDTVAATEVESYLEGLFQNEQPPSETPGPPLALDSGALLNQEIPGTEIPITRDAIVEYEVESGDTPWAIAEKFGVSVPTVLWENKLGLYSPIRPGQKLRILPVSGVTHIVRKGQTLAGIAKQYGAAVDEIGQYNKVLALGIGSTLIIPGGRPYTAPPKVTPARPKTVVVPPSVAAIPGGKMLWPIISRRVTQYFKWRHAGLDVGDKMGNPIYAAENGAVEYSGWERGGWGNTVMVNHGNGIKTRYAHASKLLVGVGEYVKKGQVIALVGSTGRSTGPHIHFGVYINGRAVNPLQYLR